MHYNMKCGDANKGGEFPDIVNPVLSPQLLMFNNLLSFHLKLALHRADRTIELSNEHTSRVTHT